MAYFFDGKKLAKEKLEVLKKRVSELKKRKVKLKLISILIGDNPSGKLYLKLKKDASGSIGTNLEIKRYGQGVSVEKIISEIKRLNSDHFVHGIMVQLPLPPKFSLEDKEKIINAIDFKKDVDGLREKSFYLTPVVKAVIETVKEADFFLPVGREIKVVVVGAKGFEGRKIFNVFKEMGYKVVGVDKETSNLKEKTLDADILISVTGSPGIIGKDAVKEGAVVIDVGYPKGDVVTEEVSLKASFISPVPGGVGPVTIACLLENLVDSAKK